MSKIVSYVGRHHWGMLAVFIALGGTAVAAAGSTQSTIRACANKRTGALRLVHSGRGCRHNERALTWSKRGPTGPAGPTGPSDGYYSVSAPGGGSGPASVKVPPGDYIANGGCTATQTGPYGGSSGAVPELGYAQAFLSTGPVFSAGPYEPGTVEADASVPNMGAHTDPNQAEWGSASLSNSSAFSLPSGGTITEGCRQYIGPLGNGGSDHPVQISNTHVTAIRVGSLQDQGSG